MKRKSFGFVPIRRGTGLVNGGVGVGVEGEEKGKGRHVSAPYPNANASQAQAQQQQQQQVRYPVEECEDDERTPRKSGDLDVGVREGFVGRSVRKISLGAVVGRHKRTKSGVSIGSVGAAKEKKKKKEASDDRNEADDEEEEDHTLTLHWTHPKQCLGLLPPVELQLQLQPPLPQRDKRADVGSASRLWIQARETRC